jgi:hypothetical protein
MDSAVTAFTCSICGAFCQSAEAFAAHLEEIRRRRELFGAAWGFAAVKRYSPLAADRDNRERDEGVA